MTPCYRLLIRYEIRLRGGNHYCTCPAWRNQSAGPVRTCKHLRATFGDKFEQWRLNNAPGAPRFPSASSSSGGGGGGKTGKLPKKGNAPSLMLAHKWDEDRHDPTGWWMSEKYDGLRAYWDGTKFLSRQGNQFCAPSFFLKDLPADHTLDGEVWMGSMCLAYCIVNAKHWLLTCNGPCAAVIFGSEEIQRNLKHCADPRFQRSSVEDPFIHGVRYPQQGNGTV